jgi:GNAT superfamily N-acetyltransferase
MPSLLKRLLWRLRHPWLPSSIQGRLRPLRFSVCREEHIPDCVRLFMRNESHGVPPGQRGNYREALQEGSVLTLVAESPSGVVGTFGLQYGYQPEVVWICYVLVNPEQHRHGIGTTMLLAALALLPRGHAPLSLAIAALPSALPFYERLGFVRLTENPTTNEDGHPLAVLGSVTEAMSRECRGILQSASVALPQQPLFIPTAKPRIVGRRHLPCRSVQLP